MGKHTTFEAKHIANRHCIASAVLTLEQRSLKSDSVQTCSSPVRTYAERDQAHRELRPHGHMQAVITADKLLV